MCGEALKWSELKLEVMIDQGNCLPKCLKADLISENLRKWQISYSHVIVLFTDSRGILIDVVECHCVW